MRVLHADDTATGRPVSAQVFHVPGNRHAVGIWAQDGGGICLAVADPEGHPFDVGPIAVLDGERVAALHEALGQVLGGAS